MRKSTLWCPVLKLIASFSLVEPQISKYGLAGLEYLSFLELLLLMIILIPDYRVFIDLGFELLDEIAFKKFGIYTDIFDTEI